MSLIDDFPKILKEAQTEYTVLQDKCFHITETFNETEEEQSWWRNMLALGDNRNFMKTLLRQHNMAGKIQMIYIDPPFFSKANYDASIRLDSKKTDHLPALKYLAYEDVWEQGLESYLKMLCTRLYLIRDLLSDNGTVWVHLDWHAVHYVRILMDEIFGMDHFVNEIIWTYKSGGTSKKYFARKHDTILVYSKNKDYYFNILKEKSYNRGMRPYHFKGVKEYKDEVGWYTMVNMKDVWQIDMVGRTSSERNGYATQKPEMCIRDSYMSGAKRMEKEVE